MAKLIYEITDTDDVRECKKIELDIQEDLDIFEMRRIIKILLYAIGYQPESIHRIITDDENPNDSLFNDMFPPIK